MKTRSLTLLIVFSQFFTPIFVKAQFLSSTAPITESSSSVDIGTLMSACQKNPNPTQDPLCNAAMEVKSAGDGFVELVKNEMGLTDNQISMLVIAYSLSQGRITYESSSFWKDSRHKVELFRDGDARIVFERNL